MKMKIREASLILLMLMPVDVLMAQSDSLPKHLPDIKYHLTARPWRPLAISPIAYLDKIEGICRFTVRHQDTSGAVIDPFLKREHQYATPYFAYAVGSLIKAGRARDLLDHGIRAMDHSTASFAGGKTAIPDRHGEFFIAPLVGAIKLYAPHVPPSTLEKWSGRLKKPVAEVIAGNTNNWETYPMKGEWMRVRSMLVDRDAATSFIEHAWITRQRQRIADTRWNLYHDRSSNPDTLNVEAVGRGNLLALIELGYDGPSSAAMRTLVESGTKTTLLLQDPSGQAPTNGRTDDHVWVDVGYQLAFEVMAERAFRQDDARLAGQYRRASALAFSNIERWRRTDGLWSGSYYVTKNHFDPALRLGYQAASQYSNYNGSLMYHLAEAYHARRTTIREQPAPTEIGGYALTTDAEFASAVANAGGMQMQVDLRGDIKPGTGGDYWTALGVVRFGRVNWDTRLGPSDGIRKGDSGLGVSFAPTFLEGDKWVRLASVPDRYQGTFSVQFAHPLLVVCAIEYKPVSNQSGPSFRNEFIITPDGILSTVTRTSGIESWGVTWPLLENDGAALHTAVSASGRLARTAYRNGSDEQNFIAINSDVAMADDSPLRSTYGDLRPVRVTSSEPANRTFIYPRSGTDPTAERVRDSFQITATGFSSVLGRVDGNLYIGRTSAGGIGNSVDLNGDGRMDVTFNSICGFVLQLERGRVVAVEADRRVTARIQGRTYRLSGHTPRTLNRNTQHRDS